MEKLCKDLDVESSEDAHLYKLSLFSRLSSTKVTAELPLDQVYREAGIFMARMVKEIDQPQVKADLVIDTLGYLCLKHQFKAHLSASKPEFTNFINSLTELISLPQQKPNGTI